MVQANRGIENIDFGEPRYVFNIFILEIMMKFTIQQIANLIGGKVVGNPDEEVFQLAKIDENATKGSICFLANLKYENYIYSTNASAVIVSEDFDIKKEINTSLIVVKDAYLAFSLLLEEYEKILNTSYNTSLSGVEQPSHVHETAEIGEKVYIGMFVYIGKNVKIEENVKIYPNCYIADNVTIGKNTIIHAGVKVYRESIIGSHCHIHSGVVIGGDGFGFAPQEDNTYKSIPQLGNVILENYVSIGANTTIDRATIGSTIIREGVKIDNLVQIGHNVEIGRNTVISAQTGISGSSKIGENCKIGGQVGLANHIIIPNNTQIGAKSGVNTNLKKEGMAIQGYPAFEYSRFMKSSVIFKQLPDLKKKIDQLEKNNPQDELDNLKQQIKNLEEKILILSSVKN